MHFPYRLQSCATSPLPKAGLLVTRLYQVLPRGIGVTAHLVSDDATSCSSRRECAPGMWEAEPDNEGGGTRSYWLGEGSPYPLQAARTVRLGTKCQRTLTLDRLCSLMATWERERGEGKEGANARPTVPLPYPP